MIISNESTITLNYQHDRTDNINYEEKYEYYKNLKNYNITLKTFDNTSSFSDFTSYQILENYIYKDEEFLTKSINIKNKPRNFNYTFNVQTNNLLRLNILFNLNKNKKYIKNNYSYINLIDYYQGKFLYANNYIEKRKLSDAIDIRNIISYKIKAFPDYVAVLNGNDFNAYKSIAHSYVNNVIAEFYINESNDATSINLSEKSFIENITNVSTLQTLYNTRPLLLNLYNQHTLDLIITNNSTDIDNFFLDLTGINENYILIKANYKLRYTFLSEENKTYTLINPVSTEQNYSNAIFSEPSNEYRILESQIIYNIILNDATSQIYKIYNYYNFDKIVGNAELKILPNINTTYSSGIKEADYKLLIYKFDKLLQFTKKDINKDDNLIYQL